METSDILYQFKTQEICVKPWYIYIALKSLKASDMMVDEYPCSFEYVPDHLKTQEMCNKVINKNVLNLVYVPDWFITQEMCNKAVEYVPDRF